MEEKVKQPPAQAMEFYHQDGLPSAWNYAMKFAGKNGRLATMPDIVEDRLNSKPGNWPWETYFTTTTAEYCGISKKNGKQILIVAHGIGPMSTLDGVQKAYSWEYQDKDRNRRGGRITQEEFWDLEAGKFGEVSIIDLDSYYERYLYPFIQVLRSKEAETDPVLLARLGPYANEFLEIHTFASREWHKEQALINPKNKYHLPKSRQFLRHRRLQHLYDGDVYSDPYIIKVDAAANCHYGSRRYGLRPIEEGYAIAHLVSTGGLCHLHHEANESLILDVGLHEWWNGVRFVGIQAGYKVLTGFSKGPNATYLRNKHWRDLLIPLKEPLFIGFCGLVQINNQWFTQYPKPGEQMDTWEPQFVVMSMKKVGKPVVFRTTVGGYHGFFIFGTNEVQAIAPPNANAYCFVGEPQNEWHDGNPSHQTCRVQFYQIEADTSKQVMRANKLAHDYDMMLKLMAMETNLG